MRRREQKTRPPLALVPPPVKERTSRMRLPPGARASDRFCWVTQSDSTFIGAGIFISDLLCVLITDDIRSGDLVSADDVGEYFFARFYPAPGGWVRLEFMDGHSPAMIYRPGEVAIQGRVVRVERDGEIVKTALTFRPVR